MVPYGLIGKVEGLGTLPTQKNQYLSEFQSKPEVKQVTRRQRKGYRIDKGVDAISRQLEVRLEKRNWGQLEPDDPDNYSSVNYVDSDRVIIGVTIFCQP
eukprot:scaffold108267_cov67-Cyclotella_meneghiniana.AAC.5